MRQQPVVIPPYKESFLLEIEGYYLPRRQLVKKGGRQLLRELRQSLGDSSLWVNLTQLEIKNPVLPEIVLLTAQGVSCSCGQNKKGKWPGSRKKCQKRINFLSMLLAQFTDQKSGKPGITLFRNIVPLQKWPEAYQAETAECRPGA